MSESTTGAILTTEKDFWVIVQRIGKALHQLTSDGWQNATEQQRAKGTAPFTLPQLEVPGAFIPYSQSVSGSFLFSFRYFGEDRHLSIHTHSDGDVRLEFGENAKGIILSLGHWGRSVELIEAILAQLDDMGECFIDDNDGDMEGYRPIQKAAA